MHASLSPSGDFPRNGTPKGRPSDGLGSGWFAGLIALCKRLAQSSVLEGGKGSERDEIIRPALRERLAFYVVVLGSALVQFHAVLHNGAMGQDFIHNYGVCVLISRDLGSAWVLAKTNPPGFHLLAASMIRLFGPGPAVLVIGLSNLVFSVAALIVFYRLLIRLVRHPILRLGALILVAFLPVRLIHGVVVASDALTLLPFFLLALLLIHLTEASDPRRRLRLAGGLCALLTVAMFIKYTFLSSMVAVVIVLVQAVRRRRFPAREAVRLGLVGLGLPVLVFLVQTQTQTSFHDNFGMRGDPVDNMHYASVLGVHAADPHVLDAPRYDEPNLQPDEIPVFSSPDNDRDTRYELMIPNRYSYLALLHWGSFTDPLNIFQARTRYTAFGERSAFNQRLMTIGVRTAVPLTLACLVATAVLGLSAGFGALLSPLRQRADVEAVLLLGLGWFSNIALFMPRVHGAYLGGYWTPRLVLPGLLIFLLLTFHLLDRRLDHRVGRMVGAALLAWMIAQSALQVAFLWP